MSFFNNNGSQSSLTIDEILSSLDIKTNNIMKKLCLYYGKPDSINNVNDPIKAGEIFSQYDIMVLNGLMMNPSHHWHNSAIETVKEAKRLNPKIEVFGYIHSHNSETIGYLTAEQVTESVKQWRDLIGATGIFLDAFGYDYKVTRERQNELVRLVKEQGLNVIANSWMPDYVFSNRNIKIGTFEGNPNLLPCTLTPDDYYIFENHIYRKGYTTTNQEANDSERVYQSAYYRFVGQEEYNGKSYYEQYGVKALSLNGLQEPNERFFNEGYLVALATGCHGYGMSGASWSDPNYSHFQMPKVFGKQEDVKLLSMAYNETSEELAIKTKINDNTVDVIWNQPDSIKDAYSFPSTPYVFYLDVNGTLNVDSVFQVTLNRVVYNPKLLAGDTAEVVAQKIASFDYGNEWIAKATGNRVTWQYHQGNPKYYQRGAGTENDLRGTFMYINASKGLTYSYDILSMYVNVIRRISLNNEFLHSNAGVTALRPYRPYVGFSYFDTTLNKILFWNGSKYVDSNGNSI